MWESGAGMGLAGALCASQNRSQICTCFFNASKLKKSGMNLLFNMIFLTLSSILCMQPFNGGFHNVKLVAPSLSSWYGLPGSGGTTKSSMTPGSLSNPSCPALLMITLQETGYSFLCPVFALFWRFYTHPTLFALCAFSYGAIWFCYVYLCLLSLANLHLSVCLSPEVSLTSILHPIVAFILA